MLEGVFRVGHIAMLKQQLGIHQLSESFVQFLLRHSRHGTDQFM
jgi:hypothetical protein